MNRRNEKIDARDYLLDDKQQAFLRAQIEKQQREEDEEFVKKIFNKVQNNGKIIKRIEDDDVDEEFPPKNSLLYSTVRKTPGQKELIENLLTGSVKDVSEPGPSTSKQPPQKSNLPTKEVLRNLVVRKRKDDSLQPSSTSKTLNVPSSSIPPDKNNVSTKKSADVSSIPPPVKKKTLTSLAAYGSDSD